MEETRDIVLADNFLWSWYTRMCTLNAGTCCCKKNKSYAELRELLRLEPWDCLTKDMENAGLSGEDALIWNMQKRKI